MRYFIFQLGLALCVAAAIPQTPLAAAPATNHWSLQPVREPALPKVRNGDWCRTPVDSFILARLEAEGLPPNPEAERRVLIRRLSFDLRGVPPAPEEIRQFIADASPRAWEALVERMLASPLYGERWARHWLDVARYTESQGFEYDHYRPNAWPYRDYVIEAFNSGKPYDQFIREQLAGDAIEPVTREGIIATSLLVCGPWDQAGSSQANATQRAITREEELEDLIAAVSQGMLGMTVNCARCHAHKFDPIPQADYYRIKAVFEGVRHGERPAPTDAEAREHARATAAIKTQIAAADGQLMELGAGLGRDELQARREGLERELRAVRPLQAAYAGTRQQPASTRLLKRGDVNSPADVMRPGALSAVKDLASDFGLPEDAPEAERRRKFADWVADARNPLTSRVMANRIWQRHFGEGIVATPSDFGRSGAQPAHPELLDWLATAFVRSGWSVKALHRLIVHSAAYRQSSAFNAAAAARDAESQLLWRFPPRRLEAEAIRDAMLAAGGAINWRMGGPSFQPFEVEVFGSSTYIPRDRSGPEYDRRTIYRASVNSGKDPLLDTLDCPDPAVKTPRRNVTLTPLQALSLMNNPFVQRQAERLARRAGAETRSEAEAAARMFEYALGRGPTARELEGALAEAARGGLWHAGWALFNSTEFMYVE